MASNFFSLHTHSQHSPLDAMTPVPDLVHKAVLLDQPAMGLCDHGNMGGTVALYKTAKKLDITPFPGVEIYIADPTAEDPLNAKTKRYHACVFALNLRGYKALVKAVTLSHTRPRFSRFPRLLSGDLIELGREAGRDLVVTTGCFFGLIQQALVTQGREAAFRLVKMYQQWFPNLIVELQNHNIQHELSPEMGRLADDADLVMNLVNFADRLGVPVIATQDTHYTDQRQKKAHALMKRMVYSGGADDEFPGDSFHFASTEWVREHYTPEQWARVEQGAEWLLSLNKLKIPQLDEFKAYVPEIRKNPMELLTRLCIKALMKLTRHMSERKQDVYAKRLDEELDVIRYTGTGNYFLLVRRYIKWCNDQKITVEARGSANAYLTNYLLKITQIDPIQWGNIPERFMSRDRIKPPDIDMDIQDDRRADLIQFLKREFEVSQIGTWSALGASAQDPTRGSVLVSYQAYLRRLAEQKATDIVTARDGKKGEIADLARRIYSKRYGHVKDIAAVGSISAKDHQGLAELASMGSVYRSYGKHAGGLLLGTGEVPLADYIPMMFVPSSNTAVSQYDMDAVEEFGLLKLDVLGQATLTVMRKCQEWMGRENPSDFSWIPLDDKKACRLLREGRTDNGIFHFEGWTKAKGGRELGIMNTKDAVLAQALYMPGAMESGQKDLYLRGRKDRQFRARTIQSLEKLHPIYAEVLAETNGAVIFQEQPMQILRMLGMTIENINVLFKVVKDSGRGAIERNAARMASLKGEFEQLCETNGVTDVERGWRLVTGFIAYGFNRAHATGYGLRSYRCAYLKAHYPLQFIAALLYVHAGDKKEPLYAREARRLELRLLPADVNLSDWNYRIEGQHIRKGLLSIPGIGMAAAKEIARHAPYKTVAGMVYKCSRRAVSGGDKFIASGELTGNFAKLHEAGALDSIL